MTTHAGDARVLCVLGDQLDACVDKADGDSCDLEGAVAGGTCHAGVCIAVACGNGFLDSGEVCEDENVSDDDDCSHDCRSTLVCRNGVLDLNRAEECDTGDPLGHDGCTSTCELERPQWVLVEDERPLPRSFAGFAYDLSRRRAVLFGGMTETGAPLDDTREWDGTRWWSPPAGTSPSNRYAHAMAYDAARKQLVVFSGVNNQSDTWVNDNGGWRQLAPTNAPPSRDYAGIAYDSARKQIVLFGGYSTVTQGALDDTWIWDGTDWREVTPPTRPPAHQAAAMAYDPKRNVTVMYGGIGTSGPRLADVWEFDGVTWTDRTPGTGVTPGGRTFASFAFDPGSGELLLTGGADGTPTALHDAYTWNGTRWLARTPIPTSDIDESFVAHVSTTDPLRSRVVVVEAKYGRLYEYNAGTWTTPRNGGDRSAFAPRSGAALALDLRRNELVMFGGEVAPGGSPTLSDETWVFAGGWQGEPASGPSARLLAGLAYDEVRDEVVMYGGCPASGETWVWSGATRTWTPKVGATQPGARCGPSMAFDAKRGKIVLVGGYDGTTNFATSTWTWNGDAWTLEPATSPPLRAQAAMAYDRARERVILFGGLSQTVLDHGDTWSWDGTTWTKLEPAAPPPARFQTQMAWDPARQRLVLAGGYSTEGGYAFADAYEWDGAAWSAVASDFTARRAAAMATAPDGAGVVLVGGNTSGSSVTGHLAETLRLRWDGNAGYEACSGLDTDGDGLAGCTDPDCAWSCTGCGDGTCNTSLESVFTCADCGLPPTVCGDFTCGTGETLASCPGDCTP